MLGVKSHSLSQHLGLTLYEDLPFTGVAFYMHGRVIIGKQLYHLMTKKLSRAN